MRQDDRVGLPSEKEYRRPLYDNEVCPICNVPDAEDHSVARRPGPRIQPDPLYETMNRDLGMK
jgi:hypothetical protein